MRSKQKKKSHVRSFERDVRVQRLIEAGIIKSADEIPGDAIPADVEYIRQTRSSYGLFHRPPYYRGVEFRCEDCGRENVWLPTTSGIGTNSCTVHLTRRPIDVASVATSAEEFSREQPN